MELPKDMEERAKAGEMKKSVLEKYSKLRRSLLLGFGVATLPGLRDRLIADERFLFKIGTEVVIDSGCATVAELQERGDEFWREFDFFLSDMIVGLVLGKFAPKCRLYFL